jgi:hypothetical protein
MWLCSGPDHDDVTLAWFRTGVFSYLVPANSLTVVRVAR